MIPSDELLKAIRELNKKTRKTPPTKAQMNEYGEYSSRSYQLRFGSWNAAVSAAGFEPREPIDSTFLEKPQSCPLCKNREIELDFHHWNYGDNKQGCYLCRDCHDSIHADGAQPSQDHNWLMNAVENLVHHHLNHHNSVDKFEILIRYNVTSLELVECAIRNVAENKSD